MAYEIIGNINGNSNNVNIDIPLGVSINFNTTENFIYNYLSKDQARDNLINVLLTQKGERVENVRFGSDLLKIVFQPSVDELKPEIIDIITSAISTWLPYLTINDIEILTAADNADLNSSIEISISFSTQEFLENQSVTLGVNENGTLEVR